MSLPYSAGLRQRVLRALEKSPRKRSEIAAQFRISVCTIYRWQQEFKEEGRSQAKPHAGGKPRRLESSVMLRELVGERSVCTIAELRALYREKTGESLSYEAMRARLLQLGLPWKRKKRNATRPRATAPERGVAAAEIPRGGLTD